MAGAGAGGTGVGMIVGLKRRLKGRLFSFGMGAVNGKRFGSLFGMTANRSGMTVDGSTMITN